MISYFFHFLLVLITGINKDKFWRNVVNIIIGLFFCSGYMVGSDWRAYELMYHDINSSNISSYYVMYEPIFVGIVYYFKSIGIDFWMYTICVKLICYSVFVTTITNYANKNSYFISLLLLLGIVLPFLFIDCPFRNLIAVSIFLYSIRFIENKNLFIYSLLSLLALGFHLTSIVMIPVYFIVNRTINNYITIPVYLASFIFFIYPETLFDILIQLFSSNEFILKGVLSYAGNEEYSANPSLFSFGVLNRIILFSFFIYAKKFIIHRITNGNMIYNLSMMYFISTNIGFAVPIFSRVTYYFVVFFIIILANGIYKFDILSRYIYIGYLMLFTFYTMTNTITGSNKYIPYSNYFIQKLFLNNDDTYNYRDNYNKRLSPYIDKGSK